MSAHSLAMPKKPRAHPKPKRRETYIRAWRKAQGYTLVQLSERLSNLSGIEISDGQLSRIERGDQPYNQDLLEALAGALSTSAASLLMRDPGKPDAFWDIYESLKPTEKAQAVEVIKALRRTGTDG